jgi:3-oxoacyl-[acyl-carrier protein] reductase
VAEVIRHRGGRAEVIAGDITEDEMAGRLVAGALQTFGRLDVWVTNTGNSDHPGTFAIADFPTWHWDAQIRLNLRPHFLAAKACVGVMETGSSIIGISSIASLRAAVKFAGYGAAKSGMNSLARTLAAEPVPG